MKKNILIICLFTISSVAFVMNCMDVKITTHNTDQQTINRVMHGIEKYKEGQRNWEKVKKAQSKIKELQTTEKNKKNISEVLEKKYLECVTLYCETLKLFFDAYDLGFEEGFSTARDLQLDMSGFEATCFAQKDRLFTEERTKQSQRFETASKKRELLIQQIQTKKLALPLITSLADTPSTTRTIESFNTALMYFHKMKTIFEQFCALRNTLLSIYQKETEEACESFWCADFLDYPNALSYATSMLRLFEPSEWYLSKASIDLLSQMQTTIEGPKENTLPTSPANSDIAKLLKTMKRDSKVRLTDQFRPNNKNKHQSQANQDQPHTDAEIRIIQASILYNQAKSTLDQVAERKKNKKTEEALGLYSIAIQYFLEAHALGFEQGLEGAEKTLESSELYATSCKSTFLQKNELIADIKKARQKRQELYERIKKVKQDREETIFSAQYMAVLLSEMLEYQNRGFNHAYTCQFNLNEFKRAMARSVMKMTESAQSGIDAYNKALTEYFPDSKVQIKVDENNYALVGPELPYQLYKKICIQLLTPDRWALQQNVIDLMRKKKNEIYAKTFQEGYALKLEPTFKKASGLNKLSHSASKSLKEPQDVSTLSAAAAAAACPPLSQSLRVSDSRPLPTISSSEQTERRPSSTAKRLSVIFKELTGLDSINTNDQKNN